jgi:hypothetical protein
MDEVARLGRGADMAELRGAFERAEGTAAPRTFTAEVASLARRGVLSQVGGRSGRTLYALAGQSLPPVAAEPVADDVLEVLAALERACTREGQAVSTAEVRTELARAGVSLKSTSINAVRKALTTLAATRQQGAPGFREAQVVMRRRTRLTGSDECYWLPEVMTTAVARGERGGGGGATAAASSSSSSARPERSSPRSKSEALRSAVADCRAVLGRPITKQELRWWVEHEIAARRAPGLSAVEVSRTLAAVVGTDGRHGGKPGRVHVVASRWTTPGGVPPRHTLGAPSPAEERAVQVEDLAAAMRLGDEWSSVGAVERRAESLRSPVMSEWAWLRRRVACHLVRDLCPAEDGAALARAARGAGDTLGTWLQDIAPSLRPGQREHRARTLHVRQAHLAVLCELLEVAITPRRPERQIAVAGEDGVFEPGELDLWWARARDLSRSDDARMTHVVGDARRFRARFVRPLGETDGPGSPASLIAPSSAFDRPEALVALYGLFSVPRTRTLIRSATALLGTVIRDREAIWDALIALPGHEHAARQSFVVAAGLLGQPAPLHLFTEPWRQPEDVAAWALGQALSHGPGLSTALCEMYAEARADTPVAASRDLLKTAEGRLRTGFFFSALG